MIRYLAYLLGGTLLMVSLLYGAEKWVAANSVRSAYTDVRTLHPYSVGIDHLLVPLNLMRSPMQRDTSRGQRLDLAFHWPSGLGYIAELKSVFDHEPHRLINVTLTPREMAVGMNERLSGVYAELFDGDPSRGPGDLLLQPLDVASGYGGEALLIASEEVEPWVARCRIDSRTGAIVENTTCLHDFQTGKSLSVTYRFDSRYLTDWRDIDAMVRKKVAALLAD